MEDKIESIQSESGKKTEGNEQYIAAIKELQENSVAKEDYEKLQKENQNLLDTLVSGGSYTSDTQDIEDHEKKITELRKELYARNSNQPELTNLEYVKKTLELRKEILDAGQDDPFLPSGHNVVPTPIEREQAERVAQVYQDCIDYADGDSEAFTNRLMSFTKDTAPIKARKK